MAIIRTDFGRTPDGAAASLFTLENKNGMKICLSDFGAILVNVFVPDQNGRTADVVLGFDTIEGYYDNPDCFGSTVGRNANRIAGASFSLNGNLYELDKNEGENNLHSGFNGYNKRLWKAEIREEDNAVCFSLQSPDKDQGFPGTLHMTVTYSLTEHNEIQIHYEGSCDQDTVVNMTNHSYFNLSGHTNPSVEDHIVWIKASHFTPVVDSASIPSGEIAPVKGTPMDFTAAKRLGQDIEADFEQLTLAHGYDHNYVLDKTEGEIALTASVSDEKSGRKMEVYTDMPGVQLYAGNFINTAGKICKEGIVYPKRSGLCLETQYYPDAIHHPGFPSPVLKAGQLYNKTTVYKFII